MEAHPPYDRNVDNGASWRTVADFTSRPVSGSPLVLEQEISAHYLRLVFPEDMKGTDIGIVEWSVR